MYEEGDRGVRVKRPKLEKQRRGASLNSSDGQIGC